MAHVQVMLTLPSLKSSAGSDVLERRPESLFYFALGAAVFDLGAQGDGRQDQGLPA